MCFNKYFLMVNEVKFRDFMSLIFNIKSVKHVA